MAQALSSKAPPRASRRTSPIGGTDTAVSVAWLPRRRGVGYGIRKYVGAPFRSGAALLLVVALVPIPPALRMPHEQLLDLAQLRSGQLEIIELIVIRAGRPQAVVEPIQVLALYAAGTSRSIRFRTRRNSSLRCRPGVCPITLPVATSSQRSSRSCGIKRRAISRKVQ